MEGLDLIKRKAVQIISEEDLNKKLKSGKKLRIKLGADPSRLLKSISRRTSNFCDNCPLSS